MHQVTCIYCHEKFDRDKIDFIQISERRYAHKTCTDRQQENKDKELIAYEELEKYIMNLFSKNYLTAKVRKQIKDYKQEYNYTFIGMLRSLKWWYEVKGNSTAQANDGIGIIPFIYEQAEKYYYSLLLAQLNNENHNYNYIPVKKEIIIEPPEVYNIRENIKLFKIEE